jgi:hypothetical protein
MLLLIYNRMKLFKQEIKVKAIFGWILAQNILPVICGCASLSEGSFWLGFGMCWFIFGGFVLFAGIIAFLAWCFDWDINNWD